MKSSNIHIVGPALLCLFLCVVIICGATNTSYGIPLALIFGVVGLSLLVYGLATGKVKMFG